MQSVIEVHSQTRGYRRPLAMLQQWPCCMWQVCNHCIAGDTNGISIVQGRAHHRRNGEPQMLLEQT